MPKVRSFAPVETVNARVLILGSMPGEESLRMGQYYAYSRNQFWRILGELAGAGPSLPYEQRIAALMRARIALWDVLESCARDGSLDSRIDNASRVANDFKRFFRTHPSITHVFFNGAKAASCYQSCVLPRPGLPTLSYQRLPSTSPAHAGMSFEQKLWQWRAIDSARA